MAARSLGKLRGIQQLATPSGKFALCAMDHRDSMGLMLSRPGQTEAGPEEMVEFKLDLCRALAPCSSGVLLDPLYGAPRAIAEGALPGGVGLLVSMEESGYHGAGTYRETRLLPGWNPSKARRMGASAAKLLVYYRPELRELAARQRGAVAELGRLCQEADMALLVEAVAYPLEGETGEALAQKRRGIVVETAGELAALPLDILKLESPSGQPGAWDGAEAVAACREVTAASGVPWVLLSRGVPYQVFRRQVEAACRGGASGFLGGRAVWQEAAAMDGRQERRRFLEGTAAARMRELAATVEAEASPWWERLGPAEPRLPADWYLGY